MRLSNICAILVRLIFTNVPTFFHIFDRKNKYGYDYGFTNKFSARNKELFLAEELLHIFSALNNF
jgi:hypothetical protein